MANIDVGCAGDKKVCLIDVSGFIYRAFFGMPSLTFDEQEVGALFGFCREMLPIATQLSGSLFIAACDSSRTTFRQEIYAGYKANRKAMPAELVHQIPQICEACEMFGFRVVKKPGFEADDIIATLARQYGNAGREVIVMSSDKDLLQLLTIKGVRIYDPMQRKNRTEADAFKKFGVPPAQILDVMALMGDSSDNIPGVPGIGPKTAAALITEFGSLDGLIANLDKLPKTSKNNALQREIQLAVMSRKLIELRYDVPLEDAEISECEVRMSDARIRKAVIEFFLRFGFRTLAKHLEEE